MEHIWSDIYFYPSEQRHTPNLTFYPWFEYHFMVI